MYVNCLYIDSHNIREESYKKIKRRKKALKLRAVFSGHIIEEDIVLGSFRRTTTRYIHMLYGTLAQTTIESN